MQYSTDAAAPVSHRMGAFNMVDEMRTLKILLVDDNEDDYFMVRELSRTAGRGQFILDWAPTYEAGLTAMLTGQHDLVLADYRLDAKSGLDLLDEAARVGHKVPFILMTGQGDHDVDVQAMEAGAADYLVKDQLNAALLERAIRYAVDRSRSEQALRESEARFRALIENSAEGIFLGRADGTITYASPSIHRILGYEAKDVVGRVAHDIVHPDDRIKVRQMFDDLLAQPGVPIVSTHRFQDCDGDWRWIESVATNLLHDPAVGAIVNNYRDVTERVNAESELRQSEQRYRTLFETNPQPCWVYHRETLAFLAVNQATIEHYGYSREEFLGMTLQDIRPPEELPKMLGYVQSENAGAQRGEVWRHRRKDGSQMQVEVASENLLFDGQPARLVVSQDITERLQAETALRESEERFHIVARATNDAIWDWDFPTNTIWWGEGFRTHFGYVTQGYVPISTSWEERVHPDDKERVVGGIRRLVDSGQQIWSDEYRFRRADGSYAFILDRGYVIRNEYGEPVRMIGSMLDITARKEAEKVISQSEERYRSLVRASSQMVWIATADGSEMLSSDFKEFTGRAETKMSGLEWLQMVHPDDQDLVVAEWKKSVGDKGMYFAEYRVQKHGYGYAHVSTRGVPILDEDGAIREWVGMTINISKRKLAEQELSRFFDISLDLLCISDAQGNFKRVNSAFETTLGYARDELMAQPLTSLVHPDDLPATLQELAKIETGGASLSFVNRYRCRDGSYKWLSWVSASHEGLSYAAARDITELKAAEIELEKSLSLLQATLESTADGILVVDELGIITDFNGKFIRMWGVPEEMLSLGQKQRIIGFAQSQLVDSETFLGLAPTEAGDKDYDLLHLKDGRIVERYWQHQSLGGERSGRVWSFRDVSERKRAEAVQIQLTAQLQQERQRLDDILDNVPGVVWEHYMDEESRSLVPDYVSDYVQTMLGYAPQEWLQKPNAWKEVLHPDDRLATLQKNEAILESGQGDTLQYRMIAKDGEAIWVEAHCAPLWDDAGKVIGLRGVSMDITERMQAQEEQARLAALLENTTDFVGWADTQGKPQYINKAGRDLLGIGEDEDVSQLDIASLSPHWAFDLVQTEGLTTALEKGVWAGQTALLSRAGEEIPISQVIIAHKNEWGEVLFFSTIGRDFRDQKNVEAALQQANDDLELRVKERTSDLECANLELFKAKEEADAANSAKSDFLSRMSHELRTPLNAILGFGQILEMRDLGPKESEGVAQILKAGRHLLSLINEVLDIARIEANRISLSPEPIEVSHALTESLDLVRPLAAARQIQLVNLLESSALPHDWHIRGDRQRFYQVLLNLLSNAIKYNREEGMVSVSARVMAASEEETVHFLRIEVLDTGPGLTEEERKRLFVPFERLGAERTKVEGTGIGLALAKLLVEAMGGHIGVDSEVGQGSVFWVEMPIIEGTLRRLQRLGSQPEGMSVIQAMGSSIRPSTVLYIEDNVANLKVIERILVDLPQIKLLAAMQGGIGLEFARQHQPDLIFLDVHLPDITGHDVLHTLQTSPLTCDIPVVIISADGTQRQIKRLLTEGAKDYLTKPLNVKQFLRIMEEYLGDGH